MTTSRPALLGRDQDIEVIRGSLEATLEGAAEFVVIVGEAGIGKSSLLEELAIMGSERGCLTLEGRASEFDHEMPFGVFTDALDAYLASLDSKALGSLATDRLGALSTVFPSLAVIDEAVEYPASATERFRVHRATRELLERLAARRPLVLILDDLHWADDASLEMIAHMLRHPPQAEVLLAMALRPGHRDPEAAGLIEGIKTAPISRNLELGPLSLDDLRMLVGEAADQLYAPSGGNPFYALQLARSRSDRGDMETVEIGVPAAVGRAILAELGTLSAPARALAQAAAVVGDPFEIEVAAGALGEQEHQVLGSQDELASRDLVRATDIPRRFRFRHPVVRSAVYSSCPPGVLLACHERAAAFLGDHGAPAGEMAYHVERSAHRGDLTAVGILRRAGEEAADTAPASAIRWFEAALRLLPGDGHPDPKIGLLTDLAGSMIVLGQVAGAYQSLEQARLLAQSVGDVPTQLTLACAQAEQLMGRFDDSVRRLTEAYSEAGSEDSPGAVSLAVALSTTHFHGGAYPSSLEWGRRAADSAETSGSKPLLAAALASQAMGAALSGEVAAAMAVWASASELVDETDDDLIVERLDALNNLSVAELYLDRYVDCVRHGERCLRLARLTGQTHLMPALAPAVGSSWWVVGDLVKSAAVFDDAIEAGRLAGNVPSVAFSLFNRSLTALWAGDLDLALACSTESLELCNSFETGIISTYAGVMHGMVLLSIGNPAGAFEQIITAAGGDDVPLLPGAWRPFYIETLTRCQLALGNVGFAAELAAWARREAIGFSMDMPLMMADRAEAEVALASDQPQAALELARASIIRAGAIESRLHTAISTQLEGRALMASGNTDEAAETLARAADEFDEMGMIKHRDQTEMLLRKLGRTVHRRSQAGKGGTTGLDSLTGREMEIAELVVDRRTNREIAEQLFLSTKTVETHMRHIFNKLGVGSRVEIARLLADTGVTGQKT